MFYSIENKIGTRVFGTRLTKELLEREGFKEWYDLNTKWNIGIYMKVNTIIVKNIHRQVDQMMLYELFSQSNEFQLQNFLKLK